MKHTKKKSYIMCLVLTVEQCGSRVIFFQHGKAAMFLHWNDVKISYTLCIILSQSFVLATEIFLKTYHAKFNQYMFQFIALHCNEIPCIADKQKMFKI